MPFILRPMPVWKSRTTFKVFGIIVLFLICLVLGLFLILFFTFWRQLKTGRVDYRLLATSSNFTPVQGVGSSVNRTRAKVVTSDDPRFGPKTAKVTVVEFGDFECPYSRTAFPIVREMMALYGDKVFFQYRDFPVLSVHDYAQATAEASQCAWEQGEMKFWQYHDKLFQNQPNFSAEAIFSYGREIGLDTTKFLDCLTSSKYKEEVLLDLRDGLEAGVEGTPTFFIDGVKVRGVIPRDLFIKILDQELNK